MSPRQVVRSTEEPDMVQLSINTIRTLSIDAVQEAKSGHPGTPMALAPLVYTIGSRWSKHLISDGSDTSAGRGA